MASKGGAAFKFSLDTKGVEMVIRQLWHLSQRMGPPNPGVVVGYETRYAIYVHEDLTARHDNGQAKYMEEPAREMVGELAKEVGDQLMAGQTMTSAMWQAGRRYQSATIKLVPVDTGLLRSTCFIKLERHDVGG